jgi:toxin ParE1/3/4
MRIEYSKRSLQDLRKVAAEAASYGPEVTEAVEERLRHLIDHIRREPDGAPRIEERSGVRVIPLIKYPYKIFYRTTENAVRVLHIRHTSRRPW